MEHPRLSVAVLASVAALSGAENRAAPAEATPLVPVAAEQHYDSDTVGETAALLGATAVGSILLGRFMTKMLGRSEKRDQDS